MSYLLCYHRVMAQREKRSVSLPPDLARAVEQAAKAEGTTFSAWLAETAAHRLKLEAGRQAIAEWERENGPLTEPNLLTGSRGHAPHSAALPPPQPGASPRNRTVAMGGVTYDTGALVAAERNNRRMWALHAGYLAEEVIPAVPAPVLAQAWRGGSRQASLVVSCACVTSSRWARTLPGMSGYWPESRPR